MNPHRTSRRNEREADLKDRHIFIIGAKSIGQYGGFEMFLDKLTEEHQDHSALHYYIVTKANGYGHMDETLLDGALPIDEKHFRYHGAEVIKLRVPQMGAAQAVVFDLLAMRYCLKYCEKHRVPSPIFYILACRIGPFFRGLTERAHRLGGTVMINPDGHDWMRAKWSAPVRRYWRLSEKQMVRRADMIVCDSMKIEDYINKTYGDYKPKTTYIAYGSDLNPSSLGDDDPTFTRWMRERDVNKGEYYMTCCRLVPENSFDIMIREFLRSKTRKSFVIIATRDDRYLARLEESLHYSGDPRIIFAGTVYDHELLKKIRENACANLHGHTVGGTNPSLLEGMISTEVNLLRDVGFNREVAEDAALYWTEEEGSLASLIDRVEGMPEEDRRKLGEKAKERIRTGYSWKKIGDQYERLWIENR